MARLCPDMDRARTIRLPVGVEHRPMDDPSKAISAIAAIVLEASKRAGRLRGTYGEICSDPWHRWTTEIGCGGGRGPTGGLYVQAAL